MPYTAPAVISLSQLKPSETARIVAMQGEGGVTSRLMEMGLQEGEDVHFIGRAPFGDPLALWVRGSRIALRAADARRVIVQPIPM